MQIWTGKVGKIKTKKKEKQRPLFIKEKAKDKNVNNKFLRTLL